jgi:hypothetical protein
MKNLSMSMVCSLALALCACGDSTQESKPAAGVPQQATPAAKAAPAAQPALPQVPTLDSLDARAEQEIATEQQADAAFEKLKQEIEAEAP